MSTIVRIIISLCVGLIFAILFNFGFDGSIWAFLATALITIVLDIVLRSRGVLNKSASKPPELAPIASNEDPERIHRLDQLTIEAEKLNFRRVDEFVIGPVIARVLQMDSIELTVSESRGGGNYSLGTDFESGQRLETTGIATAGSLNRPPEFLLQVFPGEGLEKLIIRHKDGCQFLESKGLKKEILNLTPELVRSRLAEGHEKLHRKKTKGLIETAIILFRIVQGSRQYWRPISEQWKGA